MSVRRWANNESSTVSNTTNRLGHNLDVTGVICEGDQCSFSPVARLEARLEGRDLGKRHHPGKSGVVLQLLFQSPCPGMGTVAIFLISDVVNVGKFQLYRPGGRGSTPVIAR